MFWTNNRLPNGKSTSKKCFLPYIPIVEKKKHVSSSTSQQELRLKLQLPVLLEGNSLTESKLPSNASFVTVQNGHLTTHTRTLTFKNAARANERPHFYPKWPAPQNAVRARNKKTPATIQNHHSATTHILLQNAAYTFFFWTTLLASLHLWQSLSCASIVIVRQRD